MKIVFNQIIIYVVTVTQSTHVAFNNLQGQLKSTMNTLFQTNNNTRFLEYYGNYMTPEITKANDILNTIHRNKKLLQGLDPRKKGEIYCPKGIISHQNKIFMEALFNL